MTTNQINKPYTNFLRNSFLILVTTFFTSSMFAQFQIVGMQKQGASGWAVSQSAELSISIPGQQPFKGVVPFDAYKQYPSGTTFTTHANTAISILYKGQTQIVHPNSTLKVVIEKKGIKAQTLKGTVQHVLKDVKQKVGFYKAGNGYTWAHAEGTQFTVQATGQSKKVRIATSEGRVAIVDEVPVKINQTATTTGGGRDGRELNTTKRTYNGAGQEYTTNQNAAPVVFQTYEQAIDAFEQDTYQREQSGTAYIEELADNYGLIGELYMEIGQYDKAIEPLGKAVEYLTMSDPEDLYIIDTSLYFCEALLYSSDAQNRSLGQQLTVEIINILIPELNEYLTEYNFAIQDQDEEWAWDLCYDLVDINEFLGWAYDLLDDEKKADEFYNWADEYDSRL